MQNIVTIFKKEFKTFFLSPIAYVFITVYLIATSFLYFQSFFIINQADMRQYFDLLPWIFLIFIPVVTMRSWAEEKKAKTLELLLTWPISDLEVVSGKFLAAFAFLFITIMLSISIPITLAFLGKPDMGVILASYAGALLMGAAYLAIGLWVSSLTENQIIAFILGVFITLGMLIVGFPFVTMLLPGFMVPFFNFLGLGNHFESIGRGVIDSRDVIYYLSVIFIFLFLNVRTLESRKWE
jgi:ABC-2 type transport system permease protein